MKRLGTLSTLAAIVAALLAPPARAEVAEIAIAQQYGISFMPLMAMEQQKLIEKHAAAKGLPAPKITWTKVAGPSVMNEGMLAGVLHFTSTGVPSLGLLWDRTRSGVGVRALSAICSYPLSLNTRNPAVKSIRDFTEKDKIAVPSVKVSTQAIILQMAAEKEFGPARYTQLDPLTVSLSHPDAMTALLNGTEVTAHFATSPFHEIEMRTPGMHTVLNSYDVLGGQATALVLLTTEKFRAANPKTTEAVMAALAESIDWLNADKHRAAALYIQLTGDKTSPDELYAMMADPGFAYTLTPQKVEKTIQFLNRVGLVKTPLKSWKDAFFAEAHGLPGD